MSISKYAVAQPSKHFQESVTQACMHTHTHAHAQQSHSQMCRHHTPHNWVILDVLCHSVFLDPVMCVSLQMADKDCSLCTKSG